MMKSASPRKVVAFYNGQEPDKYRRKMLFRTRQRQNCWLNIFKEVSILNLNASSHVSLLLLPQVLTSTHFIQKSWYRIN